MTDDEALAEVDRLLADSSLGDDPARRLRDRVSPREARWALERGRPDWTGRTTPRAAFTPPAAPEPPSRPRAGRGAEPPAVPARTASGELTVTLGSSGAATGHRRRWSSPVLLSVVAVLLIAFGVGESSSGSPTTREPALITPLVPFTGFAGTVAFSPDGQILATGPAEGSISPVELRDARTRRPLAPLPGTFDHVRSLVFSPGGDPLATGEDGGTVELWDVPSRRRMARIRSDGAGVSAGLAAFSPDGRILATSGGGSAVVTLWDMQVSPIPRRFGRLTGAADRIRALAFSPAGRILATGGDDHTVRLWDIGSSSPLGTPLLPVHSGGVLSVAFSPDGRTLASGDQDGTVRLWDVATHAQIAELTDHSPAVNSVAFSPNGRILATGDEGGFARLWDVGARKPLIKFTAHTGAVESVTFSPDGTILATTGHGETVHLWRLRP
ncbi:WD40 repeat domain-containing protein [Actinomadura roseirufa]|uniref:WD40 repeat domain-containing protein n=1 Tax=Actinomadura roseirufa TaxID=2094049 RepID=UPI0010415F48|nr:WD40 repeat domain-containing protein [Actinomadura roseirufa]